MNVNTITFGSCKRQHSASCDFCSDDNMLLCFPFVLRCRFYICVNAGYFWVGEGTIFILFFFRLKRCIPEIKKKFF